MRRRVLALALVASVVGVALLTGTGAASSSSPAAVPEPPDRIELLVFHGDGCPHCARMLDFLRELDDRHPTLDVVAYEVWYDRSNLALFRETLVRLGETPTAVPTVVVGEQVVVGYHTSTTTRIESIVDDLTAGREVSTGGEFTVDVPFVGTVDVGSRSLVGATVLIAFVDGVNPCSLWVLSMLMALVVHSRSRTRVFLVGGLFLLVTSLLYGLYMLGAYSALSVVGRRVWIRVAVAAVAGTFGVLHLKEHWTSRGPSVTIPAGRKHGLYRRMRALADTERSLPATLGGTAVLAVGVSLLETPCTAGLPLLWTDLLAERDVPVAGAGVLFALYLLVFLVDELLLFGAVVVTMRATKLQEHHGRLLQLIGGTLMLTLAGAMLVAPGRMESVAGTATVFGVAIAACALVSAVEWVWDRRRRGTGPKFSGSRGATRPS